MLSLTISQSPSLLLFLDYATNPCNDAKKSAPPVINAGTALSGLNCTVMTSVFESLLGSRKSNTTFGIIFHTLLQH